MKKAFTLTSLLMFCMTSAYAQNSGMCTNPLVRIAGPRQVVYDYKRDHCSDIDVPDTPTMAFKDASGQVHLFNGIAGSYQSVGSSLNDVHRDCSRPFSQDIRPAANNTPQSFDNWKWFRSPWTNDGKTIYGLIHNEFHGWEHPDQYCPSGKQNPCLFPSVTVSKSTDGGKTFKTVHNAKGEVEIGMTTPYPYNKGAGKQPGVRAPTNILSQQVNGKTYYFLLASNRGARGVAQKAGTCLYRTDDVSQPSHWRAWDGNDFTVRANVTVYREKDINPAQYVCKPVFSAPPSSWSYNTVLHQYLATVGMPGDVFGFITSKDMIHWSEPKQLMQTTFQEFHASRRGSGVSGQTYPSIIDPESPGMNFEYTGAHPYLYFTRFNPKQKGETWHNRDLIRVPLQVSCAN